jgi:hypothetical protein
MQCKLINLNDKFKTELNFISTEFERAEFKQCKF